MKKVILIYLTILCSLNVFSQKRNNIWCFGDSAGIDFNNLGNPSTFQSGNDTRGSSCAIADSNGNLLFHASTSYKPLYLQGFVKLGAIYSKNHQLMQNGDTLIGRAWFNEVMIVPFPINDSLYYVIFAGSTSIYGLYYSIVNINLNGGLGAVISKNNMLQPFAQIDCINAVKHGNGRDWWLFFRRYDPVGLPPNNEFHSYLISPAGITDYTIQNIGSMQTTGGGKVTFSKNGENMIYSNWRGLIEKFHFDRCSGIISNTVTINPENTTNFDTLWSSNELSANGNVLYVATSNITSHLFQFDMTATNIPASKQPIWSQSSPINAGGVLKRGPDDKIYLACAYVTQTSGGYPYDDSLYNSYNMNLSVINSPDSLGISCDFQPYSFYLGGKRTYWGLPNNPDYDMPALSGSLCDSLTSISPTPSHIVEEATLLVTYISEWQKLFVNAQKIKGKNYLLQIVDMTGKVVYSSPGKTSPPFFTKDILIGGMAAGVYSVVFMTEEEKLVRKFVKN